MPQVAFKPDWSKHAKAAPFKRNDLMLDTIPIGVIVFPGTGIQDNRRQGPQDGHPGLSLRKGRRVKRRPNTSTDATASTRTDAALLLFSGLRRGGGGRRDRQRYSHGDTTMIVLGILVSIAAIGAMCWLLFNLAVFALPFFLGLTAGGWAYDTGAGWLGAIFVGFAAAGLTLAAGQALLMLIRPVWARLLISLIFVAPAVMTGFHATHGIVKHTMPSETWQMIFSVIGAIVVGITAFVRVAGMAAAGPANGGVVRA